MYLLKAKQAKACRKELKKIKKMMILGKDFKILSLSDCIEG